MFTAIGRPYRSAIAQSVRMVVFCVAFWLLWAPYHLWGAIVAWGIAELSDQVIGLFLLVRRMPFRFSFVSTYLSFLLIIGISAVLARSPHNKGLLVPGGVWLVLVAGFFLIAGYSWDEIRRLILMVLPQRVASVLWRNRAM
jgi:O-antigen/teichoic acid export membrane protein